MGRTQPGFGPAQRSCADGAPAGARRWQHEHLDRIEPERVFAFRWHPYAIDPTKDYSQEPTTLVTFELSPVAGGTLLKISESGFDRVPLERRADAFTANEGGWEHQSKLIEKYLLRHAV